MPNGNVDALVQYNKTSLGGCINPSLGTLTNKDRYGLVQRTSDGDV